MGSPEGQNPTIDSGQETYTPRVLPGPLRATWKRLALPRWFDDGMLKQILLEDKTGQGQVDFELLLSMGRVELVSGQERYHVPERYRSELLADWWQGELSDWERLKELSTKLASYCSAQAKKAGQNESLRDGWRYEQLYHLAVSAPGRAMQLMKTWFDRAVEHEFNLNQGYRWLLPLEERRGWLAELEAERRPSPGWTATLSHLREYLTARSFWSEEWYKTINYLPRKQLISQLDTFFGDQPKANPPWLLSIHAPGGHGKTATLEWLLARYALPRGYICARFEFDTLAAGEQAGFFQQPEKILPKLAENLNAQRAHKIEAFQRQAELRGDPVGNFTMVVRETYKDRTLVVFLDALESLLDHPQSEAALVRLLRMLRRIREGDIELGGSVPGYDRLKVVVSSRYRLSDKFAEQLREALGAGRRKIPAVVTEVELSGFSREEGSAYLSQKRKLTDQAKKLITPILNKAAEASEVETQPAGKRRRRTNEIIPLKLALYADLVKEEPDITAQAIRDTEGIDLAYLVNRILVHIQDPTLHWVLRYGVIFRRLDAEAAQVLMPFLKAALTGQQDLDDPQLDPETVRQALVAGRRQEATPLPAPEELLDQLSRYSWVDRQGDFVQFHPDVRGPQLQIVSRQKIFGVLQQAAFQHYSARADLATDPQQKATYLREAIFHGFQPDPSEQGVAQERPGVAYWREQLDRYRAGPGPVLWAIVDEALRVNRYHTQSLLTATDRLEAYLALAQVLLAEREQPFLPDQLEAAAEAARKALDLAVKSELAEGTFRAHLILAEIALAQRKLTDALEAATKAVEGAKSVDQQVEAMKVLGQAEAANSLWARALATIRKAYSYSLNMLGLGGRREVKLELIERLLNSPDWREALPLLAELRVDHPDDPAVLEKAAFGAFKLARLEEASRLCQQAAAASSGSSSVRLLETQQIVEIYQGSYPNLASGDSSQVAVVVAAAQADWLEIESLLRAQLAAASNEEVLMVINILLRFYLEVTGDWRQVRALLERGQRWAAKRPKSDPAIARFSVLKQYIEFLNSPPPLNPEAARRERQDRLEQVVELDTPDDRVRVKAYLLLVRFYGEVQLDADNEAEREAIAIYRDCAAQALDRTLDLLLKLAPLDQVDIMRTLAVLPGWSSQLVNEVAPDPAERSPLLLLQKTLEETEQPPFLVRLMETSGLKVADKLTALQAQLIESGSDWSVLYTSFARMLAAFGQTEAALQFLDSLPMLSQTEMPVLVALDRAFLASRSEAAHLIEEAIARLEIQPEAAGIVNELMLTWAYLGLSKGRTPDDTNRVAIWLTRLFALPFTNPGNALFLQEYYLLQAITAYKLDNPEKALVNLKQALNVAEGLGNSYAIEIIRGAMDRLEAQEQFEEGQPQRQFEEFQRWLNRQDRILDEVQDLIINGSDSEPPAPPPESQLEALSPATEVQAVSPSAPASVSPVPEPEPEPLLDPAEKLELLLVVRQIDPSSAEVFFMRSDQAYVQVRTQTHLQGVKKLLPQGRALKTLPDMDYWQKLLNPDSNLGTGLEQVGAALLDDLLPARSRGRKQLEAFLQSNAADLSLPALRLIVEGPDLERIPWGILYDAGSGRWLSRYFRFSRNRPSDDDLEMRGTSIAVRPMTDRPDLDGRIREVVALYSEAVLSQPPPSVSSVIYGPELLGQIAPDELPATGSRSLPELLPRPLKILHLLADLSELSEIEGIFLSLGRSRAERAREPLTADALAHQLRQLGISRSLIILEPLSTGSTFEDSRVLMLRNSYASALARLGTWTVLAIGPRRSSSSLLVQQLLQADQLTDDKLEALVQQARQQARPGRVLEDQYSLVYPIT